MAKIGRNDPCWCGSGVKFKKCHLIREDQAALPREAIESAAWRSWEERVCLHPNAGSTRCDKVISAHTVQRSGVLGALIDSSGTVRTFRRTQNREDGLAVARSVGWRVASTFTGFCSKHDSATFAPLENRPFIDSIEQRFLLGYRALCYEIFQKRGLIRSSAAIRRLLDRGANAERQREMQHSEDVIVAGARKGLGEMQELKSAMDRQLASAHKLGWSSVTIGFDGDLCIAATGCVAPNRDLNGNELQVLHDPTASHQILLFGVAKTGVGGAAVFLWPAAQDAPRVFVESMLARDLRFLPGLLVQFMFFHLENTYFSASWWDSLPAFRRSHLTELAMTTSPYYSQFSYKDYDLVPWTNLTVSRDAV